MIFLGILNEFKNIDVCRRHVDFSRREYLDKPARGIAQLKIKYPE